METSGGNTQDLLSGLEKLFEKYLDKDDLAKERTPMDKFWGTYLRSMKDEDEARPKDWDGSTGSILTFTGLFAATVAAFIIESYKSLSRDSGDQTVVLLSEILAATRNPSSNVTATATSTDSFHAPLSTVLVNALWFISLVIALACALLATLVQQWSRDYTRDTKQRDTLNEDLASRVLNHAYIRMGVDRYGMDSVVNVIVALVHLAVMLFAVGLLLFLLPINDAVLGCTGFTLGVFALVYFIAGIMPIRDTSCPYRTPLTYPLNLAYLLLQKKGYSIPRRRSKVTMLCRDVYRRFIEMMKSASRFVRNTLAICSLLFSSARPSKRRVPRTVFEFLSIARFQFIWQHTRRQWDDIVDVNVMKILVPSIHSIMGSFGYFGFDNKSPFLDYLFGDTTLAGALHSYSSGYLDGDTDPDLDIAALELACLLLQRCYSTRATVFKLGARDAVSELTALYHLSTFFHVIARSQDSQTYSHVHVLSMRICLFYQRWNLIVMEAREINSTPSPPDFEDIYFSQELVDPVEDIWSRLYKGTREESGVLRRPRNLLHLLNSWQYNFGLDTNVPRSSRGTWNTDTSSCLIPLHDDVCCRARDGPIEHVAACAILTITAHILRASESDRHPMILEMGGIYSEILPSAQEPFSTWHTAFAMNEVDRGRTPSPEFLAVLHDAGLDTWDQAGDNIDHGPSSDAPTGFSDCYMAYRVSAFEILRTLRGHVNMIGARSRLPHDFQWLLQAPAALSTVVQNEDEQRQLALHVGNASPTSPNAVDSLEAAVSNITRSPNRGVGFDLEQVVIDTALGRISSPLSGEGAIASERPRAHISASFDDEPNYLYEDINEVLPTQSLNTEEGDQPSAQARAPGSLELGSRSPGVLNVHPEREDVVAGEPERSASSSEVPNTERLASDPMERHGEGSASGADRDFTIPQSNAGREQGQGFESGNSELVHDQEDGLKRPDEDEGEAGEA